MNVYPPPCHPEISFEFFIIPAGFSLFLFQFHHPRKVLSRILRLPLRDFRSSLTEPRQNLRFGFAGGWFLFFGKRAKGKKFVFLMILLKGGEKNE